VTACIAILALMPKKWPVPFSPILAARLPEAELEGTKAATPKSLHNLWPS
jgi:hypothetical protein